MFRNINSTNDVTLCRTYCRRNGIMGKNIVEHICPAAFAPCSINSIAILIRCRKATRTNIIIARIIPRTQTKASHVSLKPNTSCKKSGVLELKVASHYNYTELCNCITTVRFISPDRISHLYDTYYMSKLPSWSHLVFKVHKLLIFARRRFRDKSPILFAYAYLLHKSQFHKNVIKIREENRRFIPESNTHEFHNFMGTKWDLDGDFRIQ